MLLLILYRVLFLLVFVVHRLPHIASAILNAWLLSRFRFLRTNIKEGDCNLLPVMFSLSVLVQLSRSGGNVDSGTRSLHTRMREEIMNVEAERVGQLERIA